MKGRTVEGKKEGEEEKAGTEFGLSDSQILGHTLGANLTI
jgi:hypothetical protein